MIVRLGALRSGRATPALRAAWCCRATVAIVPRRPPSRQYLDHFRVADRDYGLRVPGSHDLVWGILFVPAAGFGPLPGALALACHSTGMLGKLCGEILEHVDPAPGDALRSQEQNLRAATTLSVVGGSGLGLELVTACHRFEYREALALILVLLGLVTLINMTGAYVRGRLICPDRQER